MVNLLLCIFYLNKKKRSVSETQTAGGCETREVNASIYLSRSEKVIHPGLRSEHMFIFLKPLPHVLLCISHLEICCEFWYRRWCAPQRECLRPLNCGQSHQGDLRPAHYWCLINGKPGPSCGTMRPLYWFIRRHSQKAFSSLSVPSQPNPESSPLFLHQEGNN